jgi:uncharacterized protein
VQAGWLLREGQVLAAADLADKLADRALGMLGRGNGPEAMILPRTRSVHTFGVRVPLDVAFLDADWTVVAMVRLRPWRLAWPRPKGRCILEAQSGAFERWGLRLGDPLDFRPTP